MCHGSNDDEQAGVQRTEDGVHMISTIKITEDELERHEQHGTVVWQDNVTTSISKHDTEGIQAVQNSGLPTTPGDYKNGHRVRRTQYREKFKIQTSTMRWLSRPVYTWSGGTGNTKDEVTIYGHRSVILVQRTNSVGR